VTSLLRSTTLPAVRPGGSLRRALLTTASVVVWGTAVLLLSAGFVPELDGDESELSIRITFLVLGVAVAALPVLALWLPHRRLVTRLVAAVLAVEAPRPEVPPLSAWAGPQRMFQRLRWTSSTIVLVPLLTLVVAAVAYGMFLDEDAAAIVSLVFSAVPLGFLVVTGSTSRRIVAGTQAGLDAGQVVPVTVRRRIDQPKALTPAYQSWFEAHLPDGQQVLLRTPVRFTSAADARGVLDAPDLVLVIGRGGHQGALLVPGRPQDAIWLLGPVPQVRAPRDVLEAFAAPTG
jgi:hypothetical protein